MKAVKILDEADVLYCGYQRLNIILTECCSRFVAISRDAQITHSFCEQNEEMHLFAVLSHHVLPKRFGH